MQQQHCHRLADDIAASDYDAFLALDGDSGSVQQLHNSGGRAGQKVEVPGHYPPDVLIAEGVHILLRAYTRDDRLFVNMLRQRELHEYAVDAFVGVQPIDQREQFLLRRLLGQSYYVRGEADLLTGGVLVSDIHLRGGVFSDYYDG